jgi:Domain of unknown function (DUF4340)
MQHSVSLSAPLSMQRAIRILVLLLGVQLALAAVLALRIDPLTSSTPQTPLIGTVAEGADRLVIDSNPSESTTAGAKSIVLAKRNGQWVLPQYSDAPARAAQVSSMLTQLAGLKRGLPVGTSASALKRFKLVDADFERRVQLSLGGKALGTLYVGSSSGVHKAYARALDDHAAYSVDLASYELPVQQSDWLDTGLASRDLGSLSEINITTDPHQSLQLRHGTASASATAAGGASASHPPAGAGSAGAASSAAVWTEANATPGHEIDSSSVDALARDISSLQVQGVLGTQPKPEWQLEHASLTLTLKTAQPAPASVTWTLSKPSSGDYYVLKSSQYPWFFQVDSGTGKQLADAGETSKLFKGAAARETAEKSAAASSAKPAKPAGKSTAPHPSKASH